METIVAKGSEFGINGFLIALIFLQSIIFAKIFWEMGKQMLNVSERSTQAVTELTTYLRGRNGRG